MAVGTVSIGRIGLAAADGGDGYSFIEPNDISQSGRAVTLAGLQQANTVAELMWFRDQILALTDGGADPVIPVRFSTYSQLDGYYRMQGSSADRTDAAAAWSVNLERITDWEHPKVEIQTLFGLVTNSHGVTSGDILVGTPGTVDAFLQVLSLTRSTRSNADGVLQPIAYYTSTVTPSPGVAYMQVRPQYWYQAGCRIEYDVLNTGAYSTVIGRKAFPTGSTATRLRVSNGLVRVALGAGSGYIDVSWWDGTTWDGPTTFTINDTANGAVSIIAASTLRNTPEEVVVRFVGTISAVGPVYIDLAVRRGSRNVIGYATSYGGSIWRAQFQSSTASTAISGGLRRTSNNGSGNRELLVSNNATTITTGSGMIAQPSSVGSFLFAIGAEVGGSGATGLSTAATQSAEFFMSVAESAMVVAL